MLTCLSLSVLVKWLIATYVKGSGPCASLRSIHKEALAHLNLDWSTIPFLKISIKGVDIEVPGGIVVGVDRITRAGGCVV